MLIGFVMIYSTSAVITLAKAGTEVAVDPMAETLNQIKFAVAGVILALIIWKFVPETKGKTLEQMEQYWKR